MFIWLLFTQVVNGCAVKQRNLIRWRGCTQTPMDVTLRCVSPRSPSWLQREWSQEGGGLVSAIQRAAQASAWDSAQAWRGQSQGRSRCWFVVSLPAFLTVGPGVFQLSGPRCHHPPKWDRLCALRPWPAPPPSEHGEKRRGLSSARGVRCKSSRAGGKVSWR